MEIQDLMIIVRDLKNLCIVHVNVTRISFFNALVVWWHSFLASGFG